MSRKKVDIQLSIGEANKQHLRELAARFGFMRGNEPNVTALVEAIAVGQISLGRIALSVPEQQSILEAVSALTERAEVKSARTLASFALDNLQMEEDLRLLLDEATGAISLPWITQIEEYIDRRQPFGLSYQDAAGRVWTYKVRFAQITWREKRNYLECWCEETEGNRDLEELRHNWTLRLDRIVDAATLALEGDWHDGLDCIDVEFHLLGGLAHAYTERTTDLATSWHSVDPPVLQVVRRISNTFWFIRQMLPYGKDCKVVSPQPVRDRLIDEHKAALENYIS